MTEHTMTNSNHGIAFEGFFRYFKDELMKQTENKDFSDIYRDSRAYTKIIKEIMKSFPCGGYHYAPEYFTIDHTWWEEEKRTDESTKMVYYHWDFILAVEHENNWRDWTYEAEKLDFVHSQIKVVIGFQPNEKRRNIAKEKQIVEKQRRLMKHLNPDEKIYIILMNQDYAADAADPFDFRCYELTKEDVAILNP